MPWNIWQKKCILRINIIQHWTYINPATINCFLLKCSRQHCYVRKVTRDCHHRRCLKFEPLSQQSIIDGSPMRLHLMLRRTGRGQRQTGRGQKFVLKIMCTSLFETREELNLYVRLSVHFQTMLSRAKLHKEKRTPTHYRVTFKSLCLNEIEISSEVQKCMKAHGMHIEIIPSMQELDLNNIFK